MLGFFFIGHQKTADEKIGLIFDKKSGNSGNGPFSRRNALSSITERGKLGVFVSQGGRGGPLVGLMLLLAGVR